MSRLLRIVLIAVVCALVVPISAYASDRFRDVPDSNVFHSDITWLAESGVTVGCNPPVNDRFCPSDNVTRQQMAAFIRRLAEGQVVDAATAEEADHATEADHASTADRAANATRLGGRPPSGYLKPGDTLNARDVAGRLTQRGAVSQPRGAVVSGVNTHSASDVGSWVGVYGEARGAGCCLNDPGYPVLPVGVLGNLTTDTGFGVVGRSGDMEGETPNDMLWQPAGNVGVVGFGSSRGVYGSARTSYGSYSTSLNWYGVFGRTSRSDNNYGVYTPHNLYSNNINMGTGTIATVMQNTGDTALEPGDVVVFSGLGAPPADDTGPVPAVATTSAAGNPAVAGVVLSRFDPEAAALDPDDPAAKGAALDPTPDGAAAPGSYLLVVVSGPAQVNVVAEAADGLTPGEQVIAGALPGHAAAVGGAGLAGDTPDSSGAILGKVLGAPEDDPGELWIFVTVN